MGCCYSDEAPDDLPQMDHKRPVAPVEEEEVQFTPTEMEEEEE